MLTPVFVNVLPPRISPTKRGLKPTLYGRICPAPCPPRISPTKRGLKLETTAASAGIFGNAAENFPDEEGTETGLFDGAVDRLKVFHVSDENNFNMNAKDAISAHVNWKLRIHALLSGKLAEKLDPQAIEKDNMCELGKWLYSDGRTQLAKQQHEELMAAHTQFHREAARIVRENYAGHKIGLEAIEMDSPFGKLTTKIVGILSSTASKP